MKSGCYQSGDVGNVDHQVGTRLVGDFPQPFEIDDAAVRGSSADNQLRMTFQGFFLKGVVIEEAFRRDPVGFAAEIVSGNICG